MNIYELKFDSNNFQSLLVTDFEKDGEKYDFEEVVPLLAKWDPPEVYIDSPLLRAGDFVEFWGNRPFAMTPGTLKKMRDIISPAGELLPLPCDGVEYTFLHVLVKVDCLDRKRSKSRHKEYFYDLKRFVFHRELVPNIPLFTIPETFGAVYTVERTGDPKTEFKAAVEYHGLTGLIFKKIWEG